jgi:EipB-like
LIPDFVAAGKARRIGACKNLVRCQISAMSDIAGNVRGLWPSAGPVAVIVLALSALSAGAAPTIVPHRAVYDLALDTTSGDTGPADIQGRLVFEEIGNACDGYTVNTRFVTRVESEKASVINDLRSATWESADGSSYRFVTKNYVNDVLVDQTDGMANRDGGEVTVDLTLPEEDRFDLASDVLFPTEHVHRILAAAQAGEKIVAADVFDGSDTGRKSFSTTTVIGPRRPPAGNAGGVGDEVLGDMASWTVTIGYFDADAENPDTPSYEFSYDLFENGVSRRIVLGYGDFTLIGDLTGIEFLSAPHCDP